jgi:hypothetical protein
MTQISHLSNSKPSPKPSLSSPNRNQNQTQTQNPSFGANLSFKELGANRIVKIVVIIALSIAATAEIVFWAKVLWANLGRERRLSKARREGGLSWLG